MTTTELLMAFWLAPSLLTFILIVYRMDGKIRGDKETVVAIMVMTVLYPVTIGGVVWHESRALYRRIKSKGKVK